MVHPMRRKERRVIVTEEKLEETFEVEANAPAMEMPEAVDDGLGVFFGGLLLPLHLDEEALKKGRRHHLILGVLVKEGLDLRRRLRQSQLEAPPPAEAHAVCLFRHDHAVTVLCAVCCVLSRFYFNVGVVLLWLMKLKEVV